jgi:hypothetical protein
MVEYCIGFIARSFGKDSNREIDGKLIAVPTVFDSKNPESIYAVALEGTENINLFSGQKVEIRRKRDLEKQEGIVKYKTASFILDESQKPTDEFDDEISKIFRKQVEGKRALFAENTAQSKYRFPLTIISHKNRDRCRLPFTDYPNIVFEYALPNSQTLIGFMDHTPHNLHDRLKKSGYKTQNISPELGEKLRDPINMISLVERIATNFK